MHVIVHCCSQDFWKPPIESHYRSCRSSDIQLCLSNFLTSTDVGLVYFSKNYPSSPIKMDSLESDVRLFQIYKVHYSISPSILQLPMHNSLPSIAAVQVGHRHDLYHQTSPSSKMLRSLTSACLRIVLLPREACIFPFIEDIFHQIFPESGIYLGGLSFVGPRLNRNVLVIFSWILSNLLGCKYHHLHGDFSQRGSSYSSILDFSSSSRLSHRIHHSYSDSLSHIHSRAPRDR